MAEMCLAAPVMILLWVGVDYFRVGYSRRLQSLSDAHAGAWKAAYSNDGSCFAGGGPFPGITGSSLNIVDGSGNPVDPGPKLSGSSSMFMYGTAHATGQASVSNALFGAQMKSESFITCNEVVPDVKKEKDEYADQNVVKPMFDFVKSFFKFN
jgi:hypothetical protein